ncbi:MAG TPA: hypothetical protein PLD30_15355 [Candidatus Competibacteraceae bacterium]|nr:hypothetical protein [Candidatus Competibacteraceae bacterium]
MPEDAEGERVLRKKVSRGQVLHKLRQALPCVAGMEAGGGAHYWAREASALDHAARV